MKNSEAFTESVICHHPAELKGRCPDVEVRSYPNFRRGDFGVTLVLRGIDRDRLAAATDELKRLILTLGGDPQEGLSEGSRRHGRAAWKPVTGDVKFS